MAQRALKIGIDVGGTFTHAVAVDTPTMAIAGKVCVPTTHHHEQGVAAGVVQSLQELIDEVRIQPAEIKLIAHSTTQATNALLEGDVARVGIIGMGKGLQGRIARRETNPNNIELAPGKILQTVHRFINTSREPDEKLISSVIDALLADGAEVLVASEAFAVDHPENEQRIVKLARDRGLQITAAASLSRIYGLRLRTRTAVINASMLPRMLQTAEMTEKAVRAAGITAPLMIMRSDGGIMNIDEMRKRPILTMLSGPAAGVAAALMYARVSDGIFIEVGGTSSDISVIRNGKPQIRSARIGSNRLLVRTLDVRTLGIAGGSIPRFQGGRLIDVGPRSAHIAGLGYAAFQPQLNDTPLRISAIRPLEGDPADYLAVENAQVKLTLTPSCATRLLDGDRSPVLENVFQQVAREFQTTPAELAGQMLSRSAEKIAPLIRQLVREYKLDPDLLTFVGGGGGAPAIVPFTAKTLNLPHRIVENHEVISAIGVALGIIRDSVERSILNPTEQDLLSLRREAVASVEAMGALPGTIEVTVEVDAKNKRVIAVATGSGEFRSKGENAAGSEDERAAIAAASLKTAAQTVVKAGSTGNLYVYHATLRRKRLLGLLHESINNIRVLDGDGVIRLQKNDASVQFTTRAEIRSLVQTVIDERTSYGDAGALMPDIFVLSGARIIDLTGLVARDQILAVLDVELEHVPAGEQVAVIAAVRK